MDTGLMDVTSKTFDGEYDLFTNDTRGDDRLSVRFFTKACRDDAKSADEGRMVFREVEYIQVMVPGDTGNIIVRPAGEGDKRRFVKQYTAWKRVNKEGQFVGTPLDHWGRLTLSQVEEFRYLGVRSVEQLAVLNDAAMIKMPGAAELKRKAGAFLEAQKADEPMRHLQAEIEKRDERDKQRDAEMAAMRDQLQQLAVQNERQAQLLQENGKKR